MSFARQTILALGCLVCLLDSAPAGEWEGRGLVYVVGGIGGLDPLQAWAPLAFSWAEIGHEVRVHEWTHGKCHWFRDLRDMPYLLKRADELADEIRSVWAREPGRPVYLVGHSAGAGLVLAAAAKLPPDSLARIVVLSAAVSPGFDLRPALRASRGGVVSFNSVLDCFYLGMWTSMLGTVDRVYGPGAGMRGFVVPADLDKEGRRLYDRLVQVPWRFEMLLAFRSGGHHATTAPLFLAREVAPWLKGPAKPTPPPLVETPAPR